MGLGVKAAPTTDVGLKGRLELPQVVPKADKPTPIFRAELVGEAPRTPLDGTEVFIEPVESELTTVGALDVR